MIAARQQPDINPTFNWRLELLGSAKLLQNGLALEPLEKRAAVLLAYLALEGPTSRAKLAGLIWAESTEEAARANLRQRLKRLKNALGAELIVPEETLRLRPDLEVDAVELESLTFTGEYAKALTFNGDLLANLEFEDHPELNEWLAATRERLRAAQREALTSESERLEQNDLVRALELAMRILELDGLAEDAYQRVMRLQYLRGDRSSALKTFERLKTVLEHELGIAPLAQTIELLRTIERGETTPQHAPKAAHMTLQRPPVLVGREHEWAQLEQAWQKGQMILLTGEPGAGKTRLAMDFLTSKGDVTCFYGRPGDALVSYSTEARIFRQLLGQYKMDLPDWVRLELSRILPELGTSPKPIQNEADKLRFYQAKAEVMLFAIKAGADCIFLDDLQFVDQASQESSIRMWGENLQNGSIKAVLAYREAELSPFVRETFQQAIDSGRAAQIKPCALEAHEVQTMLESLGVDGLSRFGQTMHKATGGNPMFVLETARDLVSGGNLGQAQTEALPLPKSVSAAIRNRLTKLEPAAMRLARVASVAATDFTLELAGSVLESHVLDLTESITELEQAQVLQGLGFTHDLIAQTTLEGLPSSIRALLHERIAVYLEKIEGIAARIAHHLIEAGQDLQAVPFLKKAALLAVENYQLREVIVLATQGAQILEKAGKQEKAFEFWAQIQVVLKDLDQGHELEVVIEALQRTAITFAQQSRSYFAASEMWVARGDLVKAQDCAMNASNAAQKANDFYSIGLAESSLGMIYWMQGETSKASEHHVSSTNYHRLDLQKKIELGLPEDEINLSKKNVAIGLVNHAVTLDNFGNYKESEVQHKEAIDLLQDLHDPAVLSQALSNLSITLMDQGRGREALKYLIKAKKQEELLSETIMSSVQSNITTSDAYILLDEYTNALEYAHYARDFAQSSQHPNLQLVFGRLGRLYQIMGAIDQAKHFFEVAQNLVSPNAVFASSFFRQYAYFLLEQGENATTNIERTLSALRQGEHVYRWYIAHLELLRHFMPEQRMQIVNEVLKNPELQDMNALQIFALTRAAQTQLEIKKPKKALEYSQKAMALLEHYEPEAQRAEVLLTHCQTLNANKHKNSKPFLQKTLKWLLETANNHVPAEYRESFLTKNPHNAAILELAKNAGLKIP